MTNREPIPEGVARVAELLSGRRVAMLTTRALDGGLAARPMALPEREFDGVVWFLTEAESPKVAEIAADPHVNLAFIDGSYLSLNGIASLVDSEEVERALWDDLNEEWFGPSPDAPGLTALRVDALAAEFWESPGRPSIVIPLVHEAVEEGRPQLVGDEDVPPTPDLR